MAKEIECPEIRIAWDKANRQRSRTDEERKQVSNRFLEGVSGFTKTLAKDNKSIALSTIGMIGVAALSVFLQNCDNHFVRDAGSGVAMIAAGTGGLIISDSSKVIINDRKEKAAIKEAINQIKAGDADEWMILKKVFTYKADKIPTPEEVEDWTFGKGPLENSDKRGNVVHELFKAEVRELEGSNLNATEEEFKRLIEIKREEASKRVFDAISQLQKEKRVPAVLKKERKERTIIYASSFSGGLSAAIILGIWAGSTSAYLGLGDDAIGLVGAILSRAISLRDKINGYLNGERSEMTKTSLPDSP